MVLDRSGRLVLSNNLAEAVLDNKQKPIVLGTTAPVSFALDGTIAQNGKTVAKLGLFNVSDGSQLQKDGGTLLGIPDGAALSEAQPSVHSGFIEHSNVDPSTELTALMDTQRQLEANANMIHIQDETLDKLVNDVGRIG
jgi:flagellar basal body rod protein FlgG